MLKCPSYLHIIKLDIVFKAQRFGILLQMLRIYIFVSFRIGV